MTTTLNIQDNNQQLLNDIQSLQHIEQDLFKNLETNNGLTSVQQQQIIDKINQISQMRINLYQTLSGVNNFFQNSLENSRGTLHEQTATIGIIEKELNQSKQNLSALEEQRNNKIRLVEINNYYGDKYAEHTKLMKYIIFMLVPIVILTILFTKSLIPKLVYYGLVVIIALIGCIFIIYRLISIWMRDNMNYQEYVWYFSPKSATSTSTSSSSDPWAKTSSMDSCVAQSINSLTTATTTATTPTTTTESFVNDVFTKYSNLPKKADVTLNTFYPSNITF
jgi:hypothetical protein